MRSSNISMFDISFLERKRERERERERNFSSFPWSKISQEFFAFTTLLQLILEPFQFTSSGNNEE